MLYDYGLFLAAFIFEYYFYMHNSLATFNWYWRVDILWFTWDV